MIINKCEQMNGFPYNNISLTQAHSSGFPGGEAEEGFVPKFLTRVESQDQEKVENLWSKNSLSGVISRPLSRCNTILRNPAALLPSSFSPWYRTTGYLCTQHSVGS